MLMLMLVSLRQSTPWQADWHWHWHWLPVHAMKAVDAKLMDTRSVMVESDTLARDVLRQLADTGTGLAVCRRNDPDHPVTLLYAPILEKGEDLPDMATLEIIQQRNGEETCFHFSIDIPQMASRRAAVPCSTNSYRRSRLSI